MATVILNVRACDTCGHKAVALEGKGTECSECDSGVYHYSVDWKEIQTSPEVAENYAEEYPDEIINVQRN